MKKAAVIIGLFSTVFFYAQKSENYLEIGYSSVCCGTPSSQPVMDYLSQFKKKNKTATLEVYKRSGLGREGEFNLYIGTEGLSKSQKASFIQGLQSVINTQNKARKNSDGSVMFDENQMVKKADLPEVKNVLINQKIIKTK